MKNQSPYGLHRKNDALAFPIEKIRLRVDVKINFKPLKFLLWRFFFEEGKKLRKVVSGRNGKG